MKNIIDICKDFGIEIPAEKHADFLKAVNSEYKTIAEHGKVLDKLTAATKRAETAEEALKGFEGIDPAKVNEQLAEANRKVKEAQDAAQKQLDERDFNDALKAELDGLKFTSTAARKAVESDIRAAGLKLKGGKILGLSDLIEQIKKEDASAFSDDSTPPPARFDGNGGRPTPVPGKKYSIGELMKMKNQNPDLDISKFLTKE
ncbi:MAG: phage scaffolding protein [Oscillospiraceae bacterium]|nr:phage scaffolding protein [Oscillospiraceae bacterium]